MTEHEVEEKVASKDEEKEEERGASLVEYALLVSLIAVVCIVAVRVLGQKVSQRFSSTASSLG